MEIVKTILLMLLFSFTSCLSDLIDPSSFDKNECFKNQYIITSLLFKVGTQDFEDNLYIALISCENHKGD
ncbi:hypothetical protein CH363_17885 [Leptospira haakeii]|uniref:Lipoprotein n=1 Tax=Leptospira haakeii TaxID=2023198 RepID=A0ABX4PFS8_9LEPT|nr:hypothetical protein CH363_17885 [Leptospira haakeii]PKA18743.1 hypothetical protein CH377_16420 [Leptospira haakeii]